MRKLIVSLMAAALLLQAPAGLARGDYRTVAQLREEARENWTQTYETKWRTVEINAEIILPPVDFVPVAQVGYDMRPLPLTAAESGWDEAQCAQQTRGCLLLYNECKEAPRSVNGRRVVSQQVQKGDWYDGFAPENTYVPMSDVTFGELCDSIGQQLRRFGVDPDSFQISTPFRLWAQHWYYSGYMEDALPGTVLLEAYSRVMGLPILNHVLDAVADNVHGEHRCDEYWAQFHLGAGYDALGGRLTHIYADLVKVTDILADDVPLCPLAAVKAAIEKEIEAGHIRKIYSLQLGYVLYNEPGEYKTKEHSLPEEEQRFYVKPVWQVNCLYVRSASGNLRTLPADVYDERNTLDYAQLLIDAQTGALIGQSNAQDRCEFKGFLSWEDVGGMP